MRKKQVNILITVEHKKGRELEVGHWNDYREWSIGLRTERQRNEELAK
jgi:hypothetical protein